MHKDQLPDEIRRIISEGTTIPAHVLALNEDKTIDERRQRALTRHYIDSGVGGVAIGVHTTQFPLREAGLYPDVLRLCSEEIDNWTGRPIAKIAGITGKTDQAVAEAELAVGHGFHAGLLNVAAFKGCDESEILEHCKEVAKHIPLIGFYLLKECGGINLSAEFWEGFCRIDNVLAIKVASFNRYTTQDVVKGLVAAEAENRITLYTGNDDHVVGDLMHTFVAVRNGEKIKVRFKGGLLGHWAVWTKQGVELLDKAKCLEDIGTLLELDSIQTQINAAIYDSEHDLKGCIPGLHEVLRRQGLLNKLIFLNEDERLSPGQAEKIDAVIRDYPEWTGSSFVKENLDRWLNDSQAE